MSAELLLGSWGTLRPRKCLDLYAANAGNVLKCVFKDLKQKHTAPAYARLAGDLEFLPLPEPLLALIAEYVFSKKHMQSADLRFTLTPAAVGHALTYGLALGMDNYFDNLKDVKRALAPFRQQASRCSCAYDDKPVADCGRVRLRSDSLELLASIGQNLFELFHHDYRHSGVSLAKESQAQLQSCVSKLCEQWMALGLVTHANVEVLRAAVHDFMPTEDQVQDSTKAIKGAETLLFLKQESPDVSSAVMFARYLAGDGYNKLEEPFHIVFRWVKKVVKLLYAFKEFDPILVPVVCWFPVILAKPTTPSKYFLASILGYFFPVLAKAGGSKERQQEVEELKNQAWKLFPKVLQASFKSYKDLFLRQLLVLHVKSNPDDSRWRRVLQACAASGGCRNLAHSLDETLAELDLLDPHISSKSSTGASRALVATGSQFGPTSSPLGLGSQIHAPLGTLELPSSSSSSLGSPRSNSSGHSSDDRAPCGCTKAGVIAHFQRS